MSDDDMHNELSKVEIHLKDDLNSSKAVTRPKEDENSIKVEIHLKEDTKLSKVNKGPKDRIRFRKRNGAAYQVPTVGRNFMRKTKPLRQSSLHMSMLTNNVQLRKGIPLS